MDAMGLDGEEYISAIRAGAIDPYGHTADDLQESLDAFDAQLTERILAMTPEEVAAGAQLPPLPAPPESEHMQRIRADESFVGRMVALEEQTARLAGERRALMAAHVQRVVDMPGNADIRIKELATMAAVELGLTGRSVVAQLTDAWTIVNELPAAHTAAAEGRITTSHLRTIERETRPLRLDQERPRSETDRVTDELVAVAERSTTAVLATKAKRIVNDVLTEPLQIRHDTARQRRRTDLFDEGDGMGSLVVYGPMVELAAAHDRLTQGARKKAKDDPRTFHQFRTDALIEVMLAGVVPEDLHGISPIKAHVAVVIPATELLRDAEQDPAIQELNFPASLEGRILIDADTARRIAGDTTTWERLFTDPVSGVPVTVDSYRPTKAQRDWLRARDGGCRTPWCSDPVLRADVDHTKDFAGGGLTTLGNLGHLCKPDHTFKHDSRWRGEQLAGGVYRWTSPIGQVIEDVPEPIGPIFTDMPRTPPRPPKLTRAQRRQRQREATAQMQEDRRRLLAGLPVEPGPPVDLTGTPWAPDADDDRHSSPAPF